LIFRVWVVETPFAFLEKERKVFFGNASIDNIVEATAFLNQKTRETALS